MARDRKVPYLAPARFAFRTPLLPLATFTDWASSGDLDALRGVLGSLLGDPIIADAIFVASPDLHASQAAWRDEPDSPRGQRVERSLVRYFSRMAGRATPFGLFAGVSIGRFGQPDEASSIALPPRSSYQRSTRIDNDYLFALCEAVVADAQVRRTLTFRPNTSLYDAAGRLRYAEARLEGKARSYHLVAIELTDYLERTLERAAGGAGIEALAAALVEDDPEIELDEALEFIGELVDGQILVSDLSPNVTGAEPIHHTLDRLRAAGCDHIAGRLAGAQRAIKAIDGDGLGAPAASYLSIAGDLEGLPTPVELGRLFQVDMVVPTPDATLNPRVLLEVEKAITTLVKLTPHTPETPLARFRDRFAERYESQELPLALALDEEVGIGFSASSAPAAEASPLLAGLVFPGDPDATTRLAWYPRDQHLLELLIGAAAKGAHEIELSKTDIGKLAAKTSVTLPDAFSLMTTVVASSAEAVDRGDFTIILEGAGGPSGARVLGRFCLASAEHDELVREHLRAEEALVPDAIFAEVAHLPEGRIGNILCRPVLREYEIPFLGVSGAAVDKQLPLSDLLVSVQRQRVVLRSRSLGREVIPRMTTAHNFSMRGLGVYRFLGALQSQNTDGVAWSWGALASAAFLPRLRFGRHVLCRAHWRLGEADLKPLAAASKGAKKATGRQDIRALRERVFASGKALQAARGLPRFVVLVDGDNELPVDFENELAVDSFVALIKNRDSAVLTELYPRPDELIVEGQGGAYAHQIVIPFVRSREATPSRLDVLPAPGSGRFISGSSWLYAKLYTGTTTADDILRDAIWPVAREALAAGHAERWFFIRYADPDWHLRVRFLGDAARLRQEVLPRLEHAAAALCAAGHAWKFQIDTYERETARYGGDAGIELAEEIFWADSEAVCEIVELLEGDEGEVARWQLCLRGIDMLLDDLGFDLAAKRVLMGLARQGFASEFHADTELHKQLGKRYRSHQGELTTILARDPATDAEHAFEPGFAALARRSPRQRAVGEKLRARTDQLTKSIGDIALSYVHMHANRLLRSAQRAHELVLYDFLKRHYDMLSNKSAEP